MRNQVEFVSLGNLYRTKQFSAAFGVYLICADESILDCNPVKMLSETEVMTTNGFEALNNANSINRYVKDSLGLIKPVDALSALINRVYSENFAFLSKWKPVEIPKRLTIDIGQDALKYNSDPVISTIIINEKATLKELEEYYSTEDAFKMYDMIAIDNLNKALGAESAVKESKKKR